ncbi:glycosyltransferase family 4 protein [Candidatus Daviesbacteria bacterium]|nr:glycosyltransferase family 4 protein [Candidatus Daviesbacteria bacterium]
MKIAIYSPYLDTLGGGERYIAAIAEILSKKHSVDLFFDNHLQSFGIDILKKQLSERFNLDLSKVNAIKAPIGTTSSIFQRLLFLRRYDLLIYLTDGSLFLSTAKKNILHIQSPLPGPKSFWGRIKLKSWDVIIYNSQFTKTNSYKNWPISSSIVYPPVDVKKIKPLKKKNYILSVGRFFGYLKDKKQEVLIEVFKDLYDTNEIKNWSLHLAGAASKGDKPYLNELQSLAKGFPIYFYPNLEFEELVKLYGQSSIYWHASGYKEDDPTRMEHFGISTVEAMAGGCVPVVIKKGGQVEIVRDGKCGFLWDSVDQLKDFTVKLIIDERLRGKMANVAILEAARFSKDKFRDSILKIIK